MDSTEKLNPVGLVKEKVSLPPVVNMTPPKVDWMGAGMLNPGVESAAVKLPEVKWIVAPITVLVLKAFKSVKVAVPETAVFVVVPLKLQVPWPATFVMLAVLVVALPY